MMPTQAIRLIREMQRYTVEGGRLSRLKRGFFIRQLMVTYATADQRRLAAKLAGSRNTRETTVEWVNVRKLLSEQRTLAVHRLVFQLTRFAAIQKRTRPLVIALPGGWRFIWDGNHRCTTAVMLGKTRLRCDVLRRKSLTRS